MSSASSFASQASPASKEDARGAGAGVAAGLGFAAGRRAAGRAAEAPASRCLRRPLFVSMAGGPVCVSLSLAASRWW